MTLIHVPRPPKSAYNPDRPMSSLLKSQIDHLYQAELKLPARYQTDVYVNAIKTEGEAANYIRRVTEAIHDAHAQAELARHKPRPKSKRVLEIAAAADVRPMRSTRSTSKKKSKKPRKK